MIPINHIKKLKKGEMILAQKVEDSSSIIEDSIAKANGLKRLNSENLKNYQEKGQQKRDWYNKKLNRVQDIDKSPESQIIDNLRTKYQTPDDIICPKCGTISSHGNKLNNKPYCFSCQSVLTKRSKIKNVDEKSKQVKVKGDKLDDEICR